MRNCIGSPIHTVRYTSNSMALIWTGRGSCSRARQQSDNKDVSRGLQWKKLRSGHLDVTWPIRRASLAQRFILGRADLTYTTTTELVLNKKWRHHFFTESKWKTRRLWGCCGRRRTRNNTKHYRGFSFFLSWVEEMRKRMRVPCLHSHTAFLNYRLEERGAERPSRKTGNYYKFSVFLSPPSYRHGVIERMAFTRPY
jgi:hypothetical protein